MTTQFVTNSIEEKLKLDENFIKYTFYELRVKLNLTEDETDTFLELAKIRLENLGYQVYFTGAKFVYQNANRTVQDNELMIAIKGR